MSGVFGFFLRESRSAEWSAARLSEMSEHVTRRSGHGSFTAVRGCFAVGASGPGLLAGNLRCYENRRGAVLVPDGEIYHLAERFEASVADGGWAALLDAWTMHGVDAIAATDGLFNALIFEPASSEGPRLSIVNDRWGSRRLYTIDSEAAFVFASEVGPLMPWLRGSDTLDREFIEETVCFGAPLDNRTWFRSVTLMEPATEISVLPTRTRPRRYWTCDETPRPTTFIAPDRIDRVHELWTRAMNARLSGERLGQQLSGGLDSRLILAAASRRTDRWCAVTYGESHSDEVRYAGRAANIAGCAWHHIELPGVDWLARRVALSLECDGFLDLVNAHQAGHLADYARLMTFELSGFLGDAVMGDTALGLEAKHALGMLSYWPSPVSLPFDVAFARVKASLGAQDPRAWLLETKWRRATNGWPHAAVNDLEVRKPFMDYALVDFTAGLPVADRHGRHLQIELLRRHYPEFLKAPWQKTGVRLDAPPLAHSAMRGMRLAYRTLQPIANRTGLGLKPWTRGAVDTDAWFRDLTARQEITSRLTCPNARVRDHFDLDLVRRTLRDAFETRTVAIEVVANLYRVERYLEHAAERAAPRSSAAWPGDARRVPA
jgi:asparagine synthase